MARNRIIYQSQAVAVSGDATSNTVVTIPGVQSVTYGIDVSREDVNHFGTVGAIDRIITEAPTATQEVQFHFPNGIITAGILDLLVSGAFGNQTNGLIIGLDDEGVDFAETDQAANAVNLVSGRLSSFSFEASVGGIPTVTLGFEGVALNYGKAYTIASPNDYSASLETFTDVTVTLVNGSLTHFTHAQSATISFDLGSEGLQELGGSLVYARVPTLPASVSLEVEGLAIDKGMSLQLGGSFVTKASDSGDTDAGGRGNVSVAVGSVTFTLQNATLDAVSYTNSIGDNATCSATFSCSVGSATSPSRLIIA